VVVAVECDCSILCSSLSCCVSWHFDVSFALMYPTWFFVCLFYVFVVLSTDNNNLNGTLPDELGLLTDMLWMDFHLNPGLTGNIPSTIGAMDKLWKVQLQYCDFGGTLPWSEFHPSLGT
jgi:hypothetical protein